MQASTKDLDAWNKCRADGKQAIGNLRLGIARPHGTYAKLLPYLNEHWAITTRNTDVLYGRGRGSPDVRDTLMILEQLHDRIAAATPAPFDASLHCRYLYMVLHQTSEKKIPHFVFHEIDGVLGSFRKSCILLHEKGQTEPVPPGFAALVIHLEMMLSRFLEHIVCAIHHQDGDGSNWSPFSEVEERRRNLVAHVSRIDEGLEKGRLPSAEEEVHIVVARFPSPKELGSGSLGEMYRDGGRWAFEFKPCMGCMAVPDWKVRMTERLGYVPDM